MNTFENKRTFTLVKQQPHFAAASSNNHVPLAVLLDVFFRTTIPALLIYSLALPFLVSPLTSILIINLSLFVVQLICFFLLRRGSTDLVARFIVLALWLFVSTKVYILVGPSEVTLVGYSLTILAAAVLIGRQSAILATIASLLMGGVLFYLDYVLPPPLSRITVTPLYYWVVNLLAVLVAAVLWYLASMRLHWAVATAQAYESVAQEKTRDLKQKIEEHSRAQMALMISNAQLHAIADNAPLLVWSIDSNENLALIEGRQLPQLGIRPEAVLGHPVAEIFSSFFPQIVVNLPHILSGETIVTLDKVNDLIIETHFSLLKDGMQQIQAVIGVGIDITERTRAEEMIQQAQRLDSLGLLAGEVAHDFNNLLAAMLGQASLALALLSPADPAYETIEKVTQAARRAADLTRQLLAYSGRGQFEIKPLILNTLITENLPLFQVSTAKHVTLQTSLAPDLWYIEADGGQIQQVVMNLIINGVQAIGDHPGIVMIATHNQQVTDDHTEYWQYTGCPLKAGKYVALDVSDTGSGMDEATLAQLFQPFYSTKTTGHGLGLAAILGIVRGYQGGIHVVSVPEKGSCFKLLFPASSFSQSSVLSPDVRISPAYSGGLVLVIEDEDNVRKTVADILALKNISCVIATSGSEGLAKLAHYGDEVSVVLLDLTMPGMSGEEVFHKIRQDYPAIKIVLTSGYHQEEVMRHFAPQSISGFLQKPYDFQTLLYTLQQSLSSVPSVEE